MPAQNEIRADYDRDTIVVYQAYREAIALPAIKTKRFQPPFSLNRMTWIKPSFLWMMERCGWATKPGQEYVLAVRMTRVGWEEALSQAVLTHAEKSIYGNAEEWRDQLDDAPVRVQWDPERSIRGGKLEYRSIQVGLSRHISPKYVNEWTVDIVDYTPLVKKMHELIKSGKVDKAKDLLPKERLYPLPDETKKRIGAS